MTEFPSREQGLSAVEKRVEAIWRDVLGATDAAPDRTFFELQGQSISAVRIVARIEDELGIVVDIGLLFEDPDLATFRDAVIASVQGESKVA